MILFDESHDCTISGVSDPMATVDGDVSVSQSKSKRGTIYVTQTRATSVDAGKSNATVHVFTQGNQGPAKDRVARRQKLMEDLMCLRQKAIEEGMIPRTWDQIQRDGEEARGELHRDGEADLH